ncbi:MAG: helix-turn-helix domain-containing protein [Desulfobulbaceae bacterium]|jgi:transcriptional regulator with XRE-family HTH domain|nr:helix-turn-helix domain-containing protein [Desulfobulbaceae bacterium]
MKNFSQKEIAAACGVSKSTISLILCGKRRPSAGLAAKLEAVTAVPRTTYLYEDVRIIRDLLNVNSQRPGAPSAEQIDRWKKAAKQELAVERLKKG